MAIRIKTNNPSELLDSIKKSIDSKVIDTWSYDSVGDFTHTPEQWKNKAWLRPNVDINPGELTFGIIGTKEVKLSKFTYGLYHGRFIEMLLNHFDKDFSNVSATALATKPDILSKPQ